MAVGQVTVQATVASNRSRRYNFITMNLTTRIFYASLIVIFDLVVFFLPLAALLVAYVLIVRPPWFPDWVGRVYRDPS